MFLHGYVCHQIDEIWLYSIKWLRTGKKSTFIHLNPYRGLCQKCGAIPSCTIIIPNAVRDNTIRSASSIKKETFIPFCRKA